MNTLAALRICAERHFADYTCPNGRRAFHVYDRIGDPNTLSPLDCLAPALLSVTVNHKQVVPLFRPTGPGAVLLEAMQAVLDATTIERPLFLAVPSFEPADGVWGLVDAAIVASGAADGVGVPGLKAVAVTKILHRKRPNLVPIFDSQIYRFYFGTLPVVGAYRDPPRQLWPVLQSDLRKNKAWIAELSSSSRTPDGRGVSVLRAADIIIWEHQTTGCVKA